MIILTRLEEKRGATWGVLKIKGYNKDYFTLELPWKDNQRNISCIPPGKYKLKATGDSKYPWKILDVKGRSEIYIHRGNFVEETRGCPLIGSAIGEILGKPAILDSGAAMQSFNTKLRGLNEATIEIKNFEMPEQRDDNGNRGDD